MNTQTAWLVPGWIPRGMPTFIGGELDQVDDMTSVFDAVRSLANEHANGYINPSRRNHLEKVIGKAIPPGHSRTFVVPASWSSIAWIVSAYRYPEGNTITSISDGLVVEPRK